MKCFAAGGSRWRIHAVAMPLHGLADPNLGRFCGSSTLSDRKTRSTVQGTTVRRCLPKPKTALLAPSFRHRTCHAATSSNAKTAHAFPLSDKGGVPQEASDSPPASHGKPSAR